MRGDRPIQQPERRNRTPSAGIALMEGNLTRTVIALVSAVSTLCSVEAVMRMLVVSSHSDLTANAKGILSSTFLAAAARERRSKRHHIIVATEAGELTALSHSHRIEQFKRRFRHGGESQMKGVDLVTPFFDSEVKRSATPRSQPPKRGRGLRRILFASMMTAVLATGSCARQTPPESFEVSHHLSELLQAAEVHAPTEYLELGSPTIRSLMVKGWMVDSVPIDDGHTRLGRWSMGDEALLDFFVDAPKSRNITIRLRPVYSLPNQPYPIELKINGLHWAWLESRPGFNQYELTMQSDLLKVGRNRISIQHPLPKGEARKGPLQDYRVLWEYVDFDADSPTRQQDQEPRQQGGAIGIPSGFQIDFFLTVHEGSVLVVDQLEPNVSTGYLLASWTPVDAEESLRPDTEWYAMNGEPALLRLTAGAGRLSLRAVSAGIGDSGRRQRMTISRAEVRAPERSRTRSSRSDLSTVRTSSDRAPNIFLYLVDTLRADHVSCYGYTRKTTPRLDAFAHEAVLFENCQAQSPWTRASVASIFTGLWPQAHGAMDRENKLPESATTLAEILKSAGYQTLGVTANGNAHEPWGFAQGFDYFKYIERPQTGAGLARSSDVNDEVFRILDRRDHNRPVFLWVHTIDPHLPYDPPEPFRSRFLDRNLQPEFGTVQHISELARMTDMPSNEVIDNLKGLYDGEIAANDASFGLLIDYLRDHDLFDNSLIVFVSDHGEEFHDHGGWAHGKTLHSEMLDVPLLIKPPRFKEPKRIRAVVSLVDIFATLVDYARAGEFPSGSQSQGKSLSSYFESDADSYVDTGFAVAQMNLDSRVGQSMTTRDWKVIIRRSQGIDGFGELFSRLDDRGERHNLAPLHTTRTQYLSAELRVLQQLSPSGLDVEILDLEKNKVIEDQLRALGYVE